MNDPIIRWQHIPQYEAGSPVFPDSPALPSPFLLRSMRGWHWQVEVEVYTLQYFRDGNGRYEVAGRCYDIKPGDVFLFRPGERVNGQALDERPFTIFAAHFERVTGEAMADHPLRSRIQEVGLMEALVDHAVRCRARDDPQSLREARAVLHAIYHLFLGNLNRPKKPAVQIHIEALIESIRGNPGKDWPVDRMCESVGVSRSSDPEKAYLHFPHFLHFLRDAFD